MDHLAAQVAGDARQLGRVGDQEIGAVRLDRGVSGGLGHGVLARFIP